MLPLHICNVRLSLVHVTESSEQLYSRKVKAHEMHWEIAKELVLHILGLDLYSINTFFVRVIWIAVSEQRSIQKMIDTWLKHDPHSTFIPRRL